MIRLLVLKDDGIAYQSFDVNMNRIPTEPHQLYQIDLGYWPYRVETASYRCNTWRIIKDFNCCFDNKSKYEYFHIYSGVHTHD